MENDGEQFFEPAGGCPVFGEQEFEQRLLLVRLVAPEQRYGHQLDGSVELALVFEQAQHARRAGSQ